MRKQTAVTEPTVSHRPVCPGARGVFARKKEDTGKEVRLNPQSGTEQTGAQGLYQGRSGQNVHTHTHTHTHSSSWLFPHTNTKQKNVTTLITEK